MKVITATKRKSVSIIVCTCDRPESLCATLQSIGEAEIPPGWEVELLVIDNGSAGLARSTVLALDFPDVRLRWVAEPRRGKGYAYNTGLAAASGEILLFTDDDVRVPVDWIEKMCAPMVRGEADAVQGGVRPAPHLERPWLTGALRVWLAVVDHPTIPPPGLVGANMAFRREAAELVGGFDPRLGPGAAGFYDDTVFGWALEKAGKVISYRPEIFVEHYFAPDRLRLRSFLLTARKMARSRALVLSGLGELPAASIAALLKEVPGLTWRSLTQLLRLLLTQTPDAGFVVRYFRVCLWFATREQRKPNGATLPSVVERTVV